MSSGAVRNSISIESAASGFAPQREDLISPRQLAAELGMSLRTLQRHHDARTGPPRVNIGKHSFYRRSTVDAWLAKCEGYGSGGGTSRMPQRRRARRAA